MKKKLVIRALAVLGVAAPAVGLSLAPSASALPSVPCGSTITTDLILTEDLDCTGETPAPGTAVLDVTADDVTIDLNGFSIIDNDDEYDTLININGRHTVTVKDGSLVGGGTAGIRIDTSTYVKVSRVSVTSVASSAGDPDDKPGIDIDDSNKVHLYRVTADGNADDGIFVEDSHDVHVHKTTASNNGDDGLDVENSSDIDVKYSTFSNNDGDGVELDDTPDSKIHKVQANNNGSDGIDVDNSDDTHIDQSSARDNGDDGFESSGVNDLRIHKSDFSSNDDDGMDIDGVSGLRLNYVTTSDNDDDGLYIGEAADFKIKRHRSISNGEDGIDVEENLAGQQAYAIEYSVSNDNVDSGFEIDNPVRAKMNTATGNGSNTTP